MFQLIRPLQRWKEAIDAYLATITASAAEINSQCDLSVQGLIVKTKKISITAAPTGAEQDTGFDIPAKCRVLDVFVDVTAAEVTGATKTLDVGLKSGEAGGDADGFLDGIAATPVGMKKGTLVSTGQTLGVLMRVDEDGAGVLVPEAHVCNTTAVSVTYTAGSAGWVEFRGSIYIVYAEVG